MKILFIGDIVGSPGRETVKECLPQIVKEHSIDYVIANGENLAHGRGATEETMKEMLMVGVNYFTGGDHLFWQKGFEEVVENLPVIRPANYPGNMPGKGWALIDTAKKSTSTVSGKKILLINLLGRTSFNSISSYLDDPFKKADEILKPHETQKNLITIVDFHAEATSEKYALGFYLDGRITAFVGTHTHVPTCDNFVLPKGTMYVTDAGMTGIIDSVLGVKKEIIIKSYLTATHQRFEWESIGRKAFRGVILDTDEKEIVRCDKYI